jgi:hypothetical protein
MLRLVVRSCRLPAACSKALHTGLRKISASSANDTSSAVAALQHEEHSYAQTAAARTQLQLLAVQKSTALQLDLSDLRAYLHSRGSALGDNREHEQPGPALRIMSHMLTFPLTLAYALQQLHSRDLLTKKSSSDSSSAQSTGLNIVCIGARAESSLPVHLWTEAVLACTGILGSSSSLTFIGPELQLPQSLLNSSTLQHTVHHNDTALTLQWQKRLYHAADSDVHSDHSADVYVLYNPGLGHPTLSSNWCSTIDAVLSTGKLIILTGHSERDAARDAQWLSTRYSFPVQGASSADCERVLYNSNTIDDSRASNSVRNADSKQLLVEFALPTASNPFRSLRKTVDATEGGLVVSANAYLHAIRLAPVLTAA